jgi:hypothetical protein
MLKISNLKKSDYFHFEDSIKVYRFIRKFRKMCYYECLETGTEYTTRYQDIYVVKITPSQARKLK